MSLTLTLTHQQLSDLACALEYVATIGYENRKYPLRQARIEALAKEFGDRYTNDCHAYNTQEDCVEAIEDAAGFKRYELHQLRRPL